MLKNKLKRARKKYITPKVEKIKLVAEETTLAHCQGLGPNGSGREGKGCAPTLSCQKPSS